MQTATWVLASATCLLALTSFIAVLTWRDSRQRAAEELIRVRAEQEKERILDAARKEFAAKEDMGGLKSNLIGIGILGGIAAVLFTWDKLSGGT
jgi:hypothetical protein